MRNEGRLILNLLSQVGRMYPQAVYFPIRTLYLTLKIEQRERREFLFTLFLAPARPDPSLVEFDPVRQRSSVDGFLGGRSTCAELPVLWTPFCGLL